VADAVARVEGGRLGVTSPRLGARHNPRHVPYVGTLGKDSEQHEMDVRILERDLRRGVHLRNYLFDRQVVKSVCLASSRKLNQGRLRLRGVDRKAGAGYDVGPGIDSIDRKLLSPRPEPAIKPPALIAPANRG